MDLVSTIWPMLAATSLTLAGVHLLVWIHQRASLAHLMFAIGAGAGGALALLELLLMHSGSAAEFGRWLQWMHLAVGILVISFVWFIHFHMRPGRIWAPWTITGLRIATLVVNFVDSPNATYGSVSSFGTVKFLGSELSALEGEPHPLRILISLGNILLLWYALDSSIRGWRRSKQPPLLVIGVATACAALLSAMCSQLMLAGKLPGPMIGVTFLLIILAMTYSLSQELLHAHEQALILKATQKRMDLAARAASLMMWEWDIRRDQVWTMRAGGNLSEISPQAPQSFDESLALIDEADRDMVRGAVTAATRDLAELDLEYRLNGQDGNHRWVATRGLVETDAKGSPLFLRGVSRDVTEQKAMATEIARQRDLLIHLQRASVVEQLSSTLAHELSQPLGAILRNTEASELLVQRDPIDRAELLAILTDIRSDDQRAFQVVTRIKKLLRHRSVEFVEIPIALAVRDVQTILRAEFQNRGVQLKTQVGADIPNVSADRIQMQQVLLNLLINSLEALAESPDSLQLIEIRAYRGEEGEVVVDVIDHGPGIQEDALPQVFEPFVTSKATGMGIGLSICKTIIEAHGGSLGVLNNGDAGCTARFTLPAALPQGRNA